MHRLPWFTTTGGIILSQKKAEYVRILPHKLFLGSDGEANLSPEEVEDSTAFDSFESAVESLGTTRCSLTVPQLSVQRSRN